jgi:hypothetical protein
MKTLYVIFFVVNVTTVFPQTGWIQQTSGTTENLNAVSCVNTNVATVVGDNGTILRTTDGGNIWSEIGGGTTDRLWSVSFGDTLTGIIAGDIGSSGKLLKTIDGGIIWATQSSDTTLSLLGIGMSGPNTAIAVGQSGTILHTTTVSTIWMKEDQKTGVPPDRLVLFPNYPNPFNPATMIEFVLSKPEKVKIEVFNLSGQKVETLLNKPMPAGSHELKFTAKDLPSGVYLYRIEAGEFHQEKKMVLLK